LEIYWIGTVYSADFGLASAMQGTEGSDSQDHARRSSVPAALNPQ